MTRKKKKQNIINDKYSISYFALIGRNKKAEGVILNDGILIINIAR
jgi:hypothetical protein